MKKDQLDYINEYYDTSNWLYRVFCYSADSLGFHFGFWDKNTKNRSQAILNENLAVIKLAQIKKTDRVLDAGCGVGGTAIFIAKQTGARVTGISINAEQIKMAKANAIKNGVAHLTEFVVADYTQTGFPGNNFDVIYGIESVCYSKPKTRFLKEAFRILKPGGRLVIIDGYAIKKDLSSNEAKIISDLNQAFAMDELVLLPEMNRQITQTGFTGLKVIDNTKAIQPSVDYYYRLGLVMWPITSVIKYLPIPKLQAICRNDIAVLSTYKIVRDGLGGHFTHAAQKPKK